MVTHGNRSKGLVQRDELGDINAAALLIEVGGHAGGIATRPDPLSGTWPVFEDCGNVEAQPTVTTFDST